MLEAALEYAERLGWAVFPLNPGTKIPLKGSHGVKDATTDTRQIREWWTDEPDCNIGIAAGQASGIVILDLDGLQAKETVIRHGGGTLPLTPLAKTPGGFHAFFAYPATPIHNHVKVLPGLDVRSSGGYVVAAPSLLANGHSYSWVTAPHDTTLAPVPDWFLSACSNTQSKGEGAQRGARTGVRPTAAVVLEGSRRDHLWRYGRSLRWQGAVYSQIEWAVLAENASACKPPLPDAEVRELIRSVVSTPDR